MAENYLATSSAVIEAPPDRVWAVLTDPVAIREFMFGTDVVTDWKVGSAILWRGVWKGADYEDHGVILEAEPGRRLVTTHFSPLTGAEDRPENYHTLTWTLEEKDGGTLFTLSQNNNSTREAAEHSQGMWDSLVESVKRIAERA